MPTALLQSRKSAPGEPVWTIAEFFPAQGDWTEEDYLAIKTKRLVEFDNGSLEFPPMPTRFHQWIVLFLYDLVKAYLAGRGVTDGMLLVSPYKLRVPGGKFREPDVIYMTAEQNARANENFAVAAELVMEVVSPDDPNRDHVTKRAEYAAAGVPEYWIVDPQQELVLVLRVQGETYVEHGRFGPGQFATSPRFEGLQVQVDAILQVK